MARVNIKTCRAWWKRLREIKKIYGPLSGDAFKQNKLLIWPALVALVFVACAEPRYVKNESAEVGQVVMGSGGTVASTQLVCKGKIKGLNACLWWDWQSRPTEKDYGQIVVKIFRSNYFDASALLLDNPELLELVLWMPSMGHGSVPTHVVKKDVGTYLIEDVFFIMPGDWELRFLLKIKPKEQDHENNKEEQVVIPLDWP